MVVSLASMAVSAMSASRDSVATFSWALWSRAELDWARMNTTNLAERGRGVHVSISASTQGTRAARTSRERITDGTRATAEVGRTVIGLVVSVDSHTGCSWSGVAVGVVHTEWCPVGTSQSRWATVHACSVVINVALRALNAGFWVVALIKGRRSRSPLNVPGLSPYRPTSQVSHAAHQGSAPHTQTSAWHVGTRAAIHRASTAHGRAGHQLHRTPPAATAKVRPGGCRAREGGGSRRRAASSAAAAAGPDLVDWAQGYPYLHGRRLRPLPLRPRQRLQAGLGAGHLPGRRSQR